MQGCIRFLNAATLKSAPLSVEGDRDHPHAVWQHNAIAEALRQQDREQTRALIRQHLSALQVLWEWGMAADVGPDGRE